MDAYGRLDVSEDLSIGRYLCLTKKDAHEFGEMLREKFPDIRFVRAPHWQKRVGGKTIWQEPPDLIFPYLDSLGDSEESNFEIWLEPEGWEPEWWPERTGVKGRLTRWLVINRPRLRFDFHRGGIQPPWNTNLTSTSIGALYEHGDKEHLSFVRKVIRLSEKITDRVLDVYPRGDKPPLRAIKSYIWAGRDAMRWCREAPDRRLAGNLRPPE